MRTLLLIILLTLSGCAEFMPAPMDVTDDFECKQRCGYYDVGMNPLSTAQCMYHCQQAMGY